ncbi:hypothetical protein GGD46_001277 [Rhizobium lusitanum]|uniref:Uncharacterized protein n=1 Tax=Rhizobium lusitanum TaxID=293958 RepID=A0A7X0MB54_9HYPH|nr:hypothetical protein [Rhizobium lusitanum]
MLYLFVFTQFLAQNRFALLLELLLYLRRSSRPA